MEKSYIHILATQEREVQQEKRRGNPEEPEEHKSAFQERKDHRKGQRSEFIRRTQAQQELLPVDQSSPARKTNQGVHRAPLVPRNPGSRGLNLERQIQPGHALPGNRRGG